MIGRLLCKLFGHPEHDQFTISMCQETSHPGRDCDPGEVLLIGCGRCGAKLEDQL